MFERAEEMRSEMAKNWEAYHWVFETTELSELEEMIDKAGSIEGALEEAKAITDLMNERQQEVRSEIF